MTFIDREFSDLNAEFERTAQLEVIQLDEDFKTNLRASLVEKIESSQKPHRFSSSLIFSFASLFLFAFALVFVLKFGGTSSTYADEAQILLINVDAPVLPFESPAVLIPSNDVISGLALR